MATAVVLVIIGTAHVERQIIVLAAKETLGRYVFWVIVNSVTMTIAMMVKSTAWTVSWLTKPLAIQAGPGFNALVRTYMEPDMELLSVLRNSTRQIVLVYMNQRLRGCLPAQREAETKISSSFP